MPVDPCCSVEVVIGIPRPISESGPPSPSHCRHATGASAGRPAGGLIFVYLNAGTGAPAGRPAGGLFIFILAALPAGRRAGLIIVYFDADTARRVAGRLVVYLFYFPRRAGWPAGGLA